MIQPRCASTGQWDTRARSGPEIALDLGRLHEWSAKKQARILRAMKNVSDVFDDLQVIALAGADDFYDPGHLVRNAAVGALVRLGEQAGRLPKSFRDDHIPPPYSDMLGMRNILAHRFDSVEWSTVWQAVVLCESTYASAHRRVRDYLEA